MNEDDWHAQKLFVNVVDRVCVCSVIVLCAQGMDLSRHMVLAGGRLRLVRGAINEGVSGGKRGSRRRRFQPV